jgi:hypothetical protein
MKKYLDQAEIARWQYRRRQWWKWLGRLPLLLSVLTVLAAELALFGGLPATIGLWIALLAAVCSRLAWRLPHDDRPREQQVTEAYLDDVIRAARKEKRR